MPTKAAKNLVAVVAKTDVNCQNSLLNMQIEIFVRRSLSA